MQIRFQEMQSFCGRIHLFMRHTINSSKVVDFKSIRGMPISSGPGLCSSECHCFASNGVAATNFHGNSIDYSTGYSSRFLPKFASCSSLVLHKQFGSKTESLTSSKNNGLPSITPFYRGPKAGLFQWAAIVQTFPRRYITTMGDSVESASKDTSASFSDVAPRIKFKRLDKTAKHIMQILDKEAVEKVKEQREIPDIRPGYIIQLKVEVPENKRRVSILKGIVIARRNAGLNTTFRLRRQVAGVGIESLFPLYSPNIKEIKVLDKKKVRRAKLYYLRDKMNVLKKH